VREWIPVPGSVKARLIQAAMARFEADGFDAAAVTDIARDAGVTTGALYHHFGSKGDLFGLIRGDLERRIRDRMEGAGAAVGGGRRGMISALLVSFDAAVRFRTVRILSEPFGRPDNDPLVAPLAGLATAPESAPDGAAAAAVALGAWRGALAAVAAGTAPDQARASLEWILGHA
jgi:AcrR family transcriptional regulator